MKRRSFLKAIAAIIPSAVLAKSVKADEVPEVVEEWPPKTEEWPPHIELPELSFEPTTEASTCVSPMAHLNREVIRIQSEIADQVCGKLDIVVDHNLKGNEWYMVNGKVYKHDLVVLNSRGCAEKAKKEYDQMIVDALKKAGE
jgi:hypothetical protein